MYIKSLRPYKRKFCKRYVQQLYPLYVDFVDQFLYFLESRNYTEWFPVVDRDNMTATEISEQRANSVYLNISDMLKFGNIDDLPIKNKKLLYTYFLNYAAGFNLDDYILELQDDENVREFMRYANIMSRMKGTHKAYSFFINLIRNHRINGVNKSVQLEEYFIDSTDETNPPAYSYIQSNTDKIILTDVPCYYLDENGDIQKTTISNDDKGNYPFQYQIISEAPIFSQSTFIKNFKENIHPAGWQVDIIIAVESTGGVGEGGADITTTSKPLMTFDWDASNVNTTSHVEIKLLSDPQFNTDCNCIANDGTSVFCYTEDGEIVETDYDLEVQNFKLTDDWTIGVGTGSIVESKQMVVNGDYLYILTLGVCTENGDQAYGVIKVDKSTLQPTASRWLAQDTGGGNGTASGTYTTMAFDDNDVLHLCGDAYNSTRLNTSLELIEEANGRHYVAAASTVNINKIINISGTGMLAAGHSGTPSESPAIVYIEYDSNWTRYTMNASGRFLDVASDGTNIFAVGYDDTDFESAIITKYELDGTQVKVLKHNIHIGQAGASRFKNVGIDRDGNVIVNGLFTNSPDSRNRSWMVKFDIDLNVLNEFFITSRDPHDDFNDTTDKAYFSTSLMTLMNDQYYGVYNYSNDFKGMVRVDMDVASDLLIDTTYASYWAVDTESEWIEDTFSTSSTSMTRATAQQYGDFTYTINMSDDTMTSTAKHLLDTEVNINWNNTEVRDNGSTNYPSNYTNGLDTTLTITKTGADYIRVHFDAFDVEYDVDYVYIKDTSDNIIEVYTGNVGDFNSIAVPGDTIKINFVTSVSGVDTGWHIDRVDWQYYA